MPARNLSSDVEFKRTLVSSIQKKMQAERLSVSAMAQRMGTARTAVRRILDGERTVESLPMMEGKRLTYKPLKKSKN